MSAPTQLEALALEHLTEVLPVPVEVVAPFSVPEPLDDLPVIRIRQVKITEDEHTGKATGEIAVTFYRDADAEPISVKEGTMAQALGRAGSAFKPLTLPAGTLLDSSFDGTSDDDATLPGNVRARKLHLMVYDAVVRHPLVVSPQPIGNSVQRSLTVPSGPVIENVRITHSVDGDGVRTSTVIADVGIGAQSAYWDGARRVSTPNGTQQRQRLENRLRQLPGQLHSRLGRWTEATLDGSQLRGTLVSRSR